MNASWLETLQAAMIPVAVPVWAAGAIAALLVVLVVLILRRTGGPGRLVTLFGVALIAAAAIAVYLERSANHERSAERRALEARSAELAARALAPGSALSCLDGAAGETVATACEKAIFARPESAAAAVSYMAARIDLMADGLNYARRRDRDFATKSAGVRRAIERDRYGVAAHVLALHHGCTAESCAIFDLLEDTATLKANLKAGAFDTFVERYAAVWNEPEKPAEPAVSSAPMIPGLLGRPLSDRYDFPSAASIPPVSIMDNEPPRAEEPAADAAAAAKPADTPSASTPVPPRRPQSRTSGAPAR